MKMWQRLALIVILGAVLAVEGCGFRLRGRVDLAPVMQTLYVESTERELTDELKEALRVSGSEIVEDPGIATAILRMQEIEYERIVRTIDTRGKVNGYTLQYTARFLVDDAAGETLYNEAAVQVQRNFDFDPTQVLQAENEEESLREDMRQDLVQQILRRLATVKGTPAAPAASGSASG